MAPSIREGGTLAKRGWMVRAQRDGRIYDLFKERSVVAIGWIWVGPLDALKSREAIADRVRAGSPELTTPAVAMAVGQLHRFRSEMKVGDPVLTYDPNRRIYLIGEIAGDYRHDPSIDPENPNIRPVKWRGEVARDVLSVSSRNTLGAASTIFVVPAEIVEEMERALASPVPAVTKPAIDVPDEVDAGDELFRNTQSRAMEFIKDKVSALGWSDMQELVAGLLRALGYKTRVSPGGPDRGKDIVASPDGFGFEAPRIIVEVKHRRDTIGAQDIRSFLGGRHPQDRGLYVSTGGFTKDAYYEAERANIPLALMTIEDLVVSVVENYDKLDQKTQQLLPLKRIYWPG